MFRTTGFKRSSLLGFSLSLLSALAAPADATLLTFDDVSPGPISYVYHGLLFGNSGGNGVQDSASSSLPGVRNGVVSAPNVYLSDPQGADMFQFANPVFTLNSGYFTSAADQTFTLDALAIFDDNSQAHKLFTINGSGPTLVEFNWAHLHEVQIHGFAADFGTQFVMDNVAIDLPIGAPEPQIAFLTASGLLCLGLSRRWSRRQSHRVS